MNLRPSIELVELRVASLPPAFDGLKILHLSDLHLTRWTHALTRWQRRLARQQPDLVVITGDLGHRGWRWRQAARHVARLLEEVPAPLGYYFILGNHDSPEIVPALQAHGFIMLANDATILHRGAQRLALIGLAQHRRIDTDIPAALRHVHPDDCKLMLLHYPDLVHAAATAGVDICFAGHTHGGQICYPDGRPVFRHDTLPAHLCTGIHRVGGTWLVVNRGLGKAALRVRLFCSPQVLLIVLRRSPTGVSPPNPAAPEPKPVSIGSPR